MDVWMYLCGMKSDKRLRDYKCASAAVRAGCGVKPKSLRKIKRQQRKKLRLANKA
jgi:hypothetical protein